MNNIQFPAQQLSMSKKGKSWRKQCVDFADSKLKYNYSSIRNSVLHQKINYDLLAGKIHMDDLQLLCNPDGIKAGFIPDKIQHYPIMNSKLNVLRGEESKRIFDYKVIVTNPNSISEIENNKKEALFEDFKQLIQNTAQSQEEFNAGLDKLMDFYTYEWQDIREVVGNCILNHYVKELNIPLMFNYGIMDAMTIGEEIYQCDIVGGEPTIEKLNPLKVRIFRSGYSNKVEDADMIILEDYWSPGKVIDYYYDSLSKADMAYLENSANQFSQGAIDSMGNVDERYGFINTNMLSEEVDSTVFFDPLGEYSSGITNELVPFDLNGNVRVIRVYWKSRRRIKKIKYYNKETGEEEFTFMPESYITNQYAGEEEESFWVNEAWEGTKIGDSIYVNMRPRVIQYNRLSNPSRCHFGIIGSIYNLNDSKPFSLVDMMKPYSYLYDVVHDRLNKMMARNWGKMTRLDLAKKPNSWKMDKWLYYAKTMGLFVEDSFNEGNYGASTNKLAGALNSNTQGVIDADFGNNIQQYINLLEFIKLEMADVAGISKQREGEISNRETVGGVERATLQSSHITEWVFTIHDDIKKRVLEAFIETTKIALRGRTKKFQYILPDYSTKILEVDGEEFAECDYGLVVDNSNGSQELSQKIETLAQAALQNQTLSFSTIMKLFMSASIAEKQRFVETDEKRIREEAQQQQQQQMQQQQQLAQQQLQQQQEAVKKQDEMNQRDNETKITVAEINSQAEMAILQLKNHMTEADKLEEQMSPEELQLAKDKLIQEMEIVDKQLDLSREKMRAEEKRHQDDMALKRQINDASIASKERINAKNLANKRNNN